jgi:ketol-acid reductoisomerase
MAEQGLFEQLKFHSPTAQYGVLTRRPGAAGQQLRRHMEKALEYIQNGSFAREWSADAQAGYPRFQRAREQAFQHPLNEADQSIRQAFHRRKVDA